MDAIDDFQQHISPAKGGKKPKSPPAYLQKPKYNDPCRNVPGQVEVPRRPACSGCEQGDTTTVWVYQGPQVGKSRNGNVYLRTDCIGWLLAYAADELHFQGVDQEVDDESPQPNCPAVADLHLEWDFTTKQWTGTFVAGPLEGTSKTVAHRKPGMCSKQNPKQRRTSPRPL